MAADPETTFNADEHVRRVVDMLLRREGRRQRHLAEWLGFTRQTATNKMRGETRFRLDELQTLARVFQVDVAVFVDPSRPVPTTPVLPPVPESGHGLLTCTFKQSPQVRGCGQPLSGIPAKSVLFSSSRAA
jgi:hypothetical protein